MILSRKDINMIIDDIYDDKSISIVAVYVLNNFLNCKNIKILDDYNKRHKTNLVFEESYKLKFLYENNFKCYLDTLNCSDFKFYTFLNNIFNFDFDTWKILQYKRKNKHENIDDITYIKHILDYNNITKEKEWNKYIKTVKTINCSQLNE